MAVKMAYFNWLVDRAGAYPWLSRENETYFRLLAHLNGTPFVPMVERDNNRRMDGIALRRRYDAEWNSNVSQINFECSMLEMMVALAVRCEEDIMVRPCEESRVNVWFWGMIVNLGLAGMDDHHFDEKLVSDILERLTYRGYGPNGEGGLFYVKNPPGDMRNAEIWAQMMWYLNEMIFEGRI